MTAWKMILCAVCCCATVPPAVPGDLGVRFDRTVVTDHWPGDYGLRSVDVNDDGWPDLVAYAWGAGNLSWFMNLGKRGAWKEYPIAAPGSLPGVVDVDFFDVDGDGMVDVVAAWQLNVPPKSPNEGQIGWFQNPGNESDAAWTYRPIADSSNYIPGIHRVRIAHFAGPEMPPTVVGIPIFDYGAAPPAYNNTPCSITVYEVPPNPAENSSPWKGVVIDKSLHVCHTVRMVSDASVSPFLLEDSQEGVTKIAFEASGRPTLTLLSPGDPPLVYSPYKGSQGVRVGYQDGAPLYMAQIGPWEGKYILTPGSVAVLYNSHSSSLYSAPLSRTLLDTVGPAVHDVATGDFDGDGIDEFLVGQRGPVQGVWLFRHPRVHTPSDLASNWTFAPVDIEPGWGACQLVVRDFDLDGRPDFASTGFPGFPGATTGGKFVATYYNNGLV